LVCSHQVPRHERGELERLEKLVNKYERGQIQRVDWLDRLTFKTMERIKERESLKNGSSHYLVVDFCSFEHRVVFQVFLHLICAIAQSISLTKLPVGYLVNEQKYIYFQ